MLPCIQNGTNWRLLCRFQRNKAHHAWCISYVIAADWCGKSCLFSAFLLRAKIFSKALQWVCSKGATAFQHCCRPRCRMIAGVLQQKHNGY